MKNQLNNSTIYNADFPAGHIAEIKWYNKPHAYCFFNVIITIRILGLMSLISYLIVVLYTWMFSNLNGYTYFSAGEPNLFIKYTEWILGVLRACFKIHIV